MNNKDVLIKKYKDLIRPVQKTTQEHINWLKMIADIEKIELSKFSRWDIDMFYKNTYYSLLNLTPKTKELKSNFAEDNFSAKYKSDEFIFHCYRLLRNEKNNVYYNNNYVHNFTDENVNYIYVIFEEKTGVFYCNSNKLALELIISKGVTKYDYDNDTILLIELLSSIEFLRRQEY